MKPNKMLFLLAAAWLTAFTAAADSRSTELLRQLRQRLETMPGYRVDFTVTAGGQCFEGFYSVRGEAYYMTFAGAEVYGTGDTRYEVNPGTREVVIDTTDPASRNILTNPTQAFYLLDGSFTHVLRSESEEGATVVLTPVGKQGGIGRVELEMTTRPVAPQRLRYEMEGESVTVEVTALQSETTPLKTFSAAAYPGFEIIDFR